MSEYLVFQKPIEDIGIFRIYCRFNRYLMKNQCRYELWICKELETDNILVSLSDKELESFSQIYKRDKIQYFIPVVNPSTKKCVL